MSYSVCHTVDIPTHTHPAKKGCYEYCDSCWRELKSRPPLKGYITQKLGKTVGTLRCGSRRCIPAAPAIHAVHNRMKIDFFSIGTDSLLYLKMEAAVLQFAALGALDLLGLSRVIPWRDVRQLIAQYLTKLEVEMIAVALHPQLQEGLLRSSTLCREIVQGGYLELLKWARANGLAWDVLTCAYAAADGRLDIMKWAHANGCPMDKTTCVSAARNGQLEVLQWARANGCHWTSSTCEYAARGGHLDVLKWAHANGCTMDESWICPNAAEGGHLEVLQWAREHGRRHTVQNGWYCANHNCPRPCPWDTRTCSCAAHNGHLEVLKWAIGNGCPLDMKECLYIANRSGHFHIVAWLNSDECRSVRARKN